MVMLHTQTKTYNYIGQSLSAAIGSSASFLHEYHPADEKRPYYQSLNLNDANIASRDEVIITVIDPTLDAAGTSVGLFDNSRSVKQEAIVDIIATFFIILCWFAGLLSFSGPVVMLVITPVEQMVRLLGMLSLDPLCYQSTTRFKKFLHDEFIMSKNSRWSIELLKGMETCLLKSTILRIGSLMKVGFGSAGVQIIQKNLETGKDKNMISLNSQGMTVSCIFLFCDIRQFTDATEQLQEEVFVFTNRIAAVIHSICNSYDGVANKNVGDAFLVSWSLDNEIRNGDIDSLKGKGHQADKALLSVIKICISIACDNFFLGSLSDAASGRLKAKLKDRTGSIVRMGFGLHAGKAVRGAIGSQRKIDAAYVAESVGKAEFLESSTKKYELQVLLSGECHELLHSRTKDRCRKIDQILLLGHDYECHNDKDRLMDLFSFDMDVDALQRHNRSTQNAENDEFRSTEHILEGRNKKRSIRNRRKDHVQQTRTNKFEYRRYGVDQSKTSCWDPCYSPILQNSDGTESSTPLSPQRPAPNFHNVWLSSDVKKIRQRYVQGKFFFQKYKSGLEAFYDKEWGKARTDFRYVLDNFDDGPSKYFIKIIDKNSGIPPEDFKEYGIVSMSTM